MTIATQPLRDEHKELLPHIEFLRTTADSIGNASREQVQQNVEEAYRFLSQHLLIHAQAEEQVLYPLVGKLMGAEEATATMKRDHAEISHLITELGSLREKARAGNALSAGLERELRRVLYGLYAIIEVHFAKEEEIYLPILDARLTAEEARILFSTMEAAAQEARDKIKGIRA